MKKMVVENEKTEKIYSIYVSDFHLEMILVPYINEKINNNENVVIQTEKDLKSTVEILMSKMNLKNEEKINILNLGWRKGEKEIIENSNIIIIGTKEYIQNIHDKIEKNHIRCKDIIDCYDFEEIKEEIDNIVCKYNKSLNTLGYNKK